MSSSIYNALLWTYVLLAVCTCIHIYLSLGRNDPAGDEDDDPSE